MRSSDVEEDRFRLALHVDIEAMDYAPVGVVALGDQGRAASFGG